MSSLSKPLTARTLTCNSRKRESAAAVVLNSPPESFLFLGRNGDANALEHQLYSARSTARVVKNNRNLAVKQGLVATA